jgi:hypothetical protein
MQSEAFVRGMLSQALKMRSESAWYEFFLRAELRGWIKACRAALGELND